MLTSEGVIKLLRMRWAVRVVRQDEVCMLFRWRNLIKMKNVELLPINVKILIRSNFGSGMWEQGENRLFSGTEELACICG
jgi:hypothetical protein